MTRGELTHMLGLGIPHFEENSQVDPIHSSGEATSVLFRQDVTVLWFDQLSHTFKALLSFPNINSKTKPFDFTLELYQNPTGAGLCCPLGPFPLKRGDCLLVPKWVAPQLDTTGWQLSPLPTHTSREESSEVPADNAWHCPLISSHKPPTHGGGGRTAGGIWFPMNAMITNVKDLGSYRLPSEKPS